MWVRYGPDEIAQGLQCTTKSKVGFIQILNHQIAVAKPLIVRFRSNFAQWHYTTKFKIKR